MLLLGNYLTDGLDVLPIEIFGVDAFEVVGEDIEDPHFLLVVFEERGDCVMALGLAADEGKYVVDEIGLGILLEVSFLIQLGGFFNAWLVVLSLPFSCIINIMGRVILLNFDHHLRLLGLAFSKQVHIVSRPFAGQVELANLRE